VIQILRARKSDVGAIAPLFDAYRVFYQQESNIEAARLFLSKNLSEDLSIVLSALWQGQTVGFTQLYTTYSSVSLKPFLILNDLYVSTEFRGKGVGEKLLEAAKELCGELGYKGLALETANGNPAQQLYEKLGWQKDTDYLHYFWTNPVQNP